MKSGFCAPSSWSMFSTGPSAARLTLPGDGVVKDGDVVKFDAGVNAEFDFYTTDTSRAGLLETGNPALLKLKDRLYEGQRRMIAAAKPGLPMNELFHIAYDYVKEKFPCYRERPSRAFDQYGTCHSGSALYQCNGNQTPGARDGAGNGGSLLY